MPVPGPFDALDNLSADELRQRLQSLQAMLERTPVPIAIAHDPECHYISANRAATELLHLPPEANITLTPGNGTPPPYRIQRNGHDIPRDELPMQYAIAHRTRVSNEITIVRGDGSVVYVQNEVEPVYDTRGHVVGCVSVFFDVTDRKLSELSLLNADRRKDEFLATLSHELRNPLAPLRTAIELMRLAPGNPEILEKARVTMERQLLHLVHITDDLLDIARITQNKMELRRERLDLRAVVQSAIEAARPFIDAQRHALMLDLPKLPLWADADFTRLSQVFSNLLNNSAKYTARGGLIRIKASTDGAWASVSVTDTGVGIAAELLPRVFEMFTQLEAHRDRTHGGLGIGLTLARRLVELHGGTISAQSEGPGRGSSFTVRLPLVDVSHETRGGVTSAAERPQSRRVLIAEDNADAAEMLRMMLELKGHDVRVAPDGVQAVALVESFDPQIAFLDIGMPRMDGYEAARHIRQLKGGRVMLVALTGWAQDEDKRLSRDAGFDFHLTKPPEPDVVDDLIAQCGH